MNIEHDDDRRDDAFLRLLADAAGPSAPPPQVVTAAKGAYAWRTIEADLAAITFDSEEVSGELVGVRGSGPRALTFEAGDAMVELEIAEVGAVRTLQGQVTPQGVASLELQRVGGGEVVTLEVDGLGRFKASGVQSGRWRLQCRFLASAGGGALFTEWVLI